METRELKCTLRTPNGTAGARAVRRTGQIPATCYGRGIDPLNLAVISTELSAALRGPLGSNAPLTLKIEGDKRELVVMLQDYQRHPITRRVVHADFRLLDEREVEVTVPLRLTGKAVGVAKGGRLRQITREVRLRCLPALIPTEIAYDITALDLKTRSRISEIVPPDGVKLVYKQDFTVAEVSLAKEELEVATSAETPAAAAAAPAAEAKEEKKPADDKAKKK